MTFISVSALTSFDLGEVYKILKAGSLEKKLSLFSRTRAGKICV